MICTLELIICISLFFLLVLLMCQWMKEVTLAHFFQLVFVKPLEFPNQDVRTGILILYTRDLH